MFYRFLVRPILFCFDPEFIHHSVVRFLKFLFKIPGIKGFFLLIFRNNVDNSPVEIAGIRFPNRVGVAAGFDKNAELVDVLPFFGFGHVEIGTVTPKQQVGNPRPRLFRLVKDMALINRMGFNNDGVECVALRLRKRKTNIIVGGNIGKNTLTSNEEAPNDYLMCFKHLYNWVDYFVVNVSCPNISNLSELQNGEQLYKILSLLVDFRNQQNVYKPIFLKISPDLTFSQVDETLQIINQLHIDGVVVSNTTTQRDNLITRRDVINSIGKGGLSGKPLKRRSTELISYIAQKTQNKLPIIGVGGIMEVNDAIEKIKAGASLVQIYTGFIYQGPFFVKKINKLLK